ncbi:phosphogluconate dehydrogenase (NAD(+)-dependent, decarboxylating) [Arthrobacter caoxuetaonis]|uniref:phosphogluconate dehydrogenase (NAD(+)-dependent, decarboxylating) n=1 Tax=Arthrobacter caoxuetaonis TaxID=2886935 RepID=UPI001D159FB5|nr:decarboxylating 6-phosphogluconate dehydrogenase [Arthrobacter caoxuetaonis]MCC3281772.1 decarboxylating 6-phosphogluconate dehydrogenase [Arthrobacter caoxuetaonis]
MHIGLIGLGKMGFSMRERLRNNGIQVTGFDKNPVISDAGSLAELAAELPAPRIVWVMVPSGATTAAVISDLAEVLDGGDLVIDGGNSRFSDDLRHSELLARKGIRYLDCGVSGGIWGLEKGYGLMVGGSAADVDRALPLFDALRPSGHRADSFVHAGGTGAGHYAKMVHNGIEYGLMQAYAEGYELLAAQEIIDDVPGILRAWQSGTVIRSWLLELAVRALEEDPGLERVAGFVEDSEEGRWTVEEAMAAEIPAPAIASAVFARFASRQDDSPAMKLVAALRGQFGGHAVKTARQEQEPGRGGVPLSAAEQAIRDAGTPE